MDVISLLNFLEQADEIAASADLDVLLEKTLELLMGACGGAAGLIYLPRRGAQSVAPRLLVLGEEDLRQRLERRPLADNLALAETVLQQGTPLWLADLSAVQTTYPRLAELAAAGLVNTLALPICLAGTSLAAVQLFDCAHADPLLAQRLSHRLAPDLDKAVQLEASQQRHRRLEALIGIIGQIGATLDRDQILRIIIQQARQFLGSEGASLFLLDESEGNLVLQVASNVNENVRVENLRVPAGKGIIGHVVASGETVLVADATQDARHYREVDLSSGFVTRSILAVPLRTKTVDLGSGRGASRERIIGGLEAINKLDGTFDEDDAHLLRILANQAATVLEIATLYAEANELFMDVVKSLTAAIDAKDPYTEGHSERVSEFSAAIARQLGLPAEMIHHIRVGALLHDVGKIGVPDAVLRKPGRLTEAEFELMKQHPIIGARIMGAVRMLQAELPAMAEHQERLDGSGYPQGLRDGEISLTSRIVSVADVFDAMTSDRPYRRALPAAEVCQYLQDRAHQFDQTCVQALIRAYEKGEIVPQNERGELPSR